jgi:hypothetical protein
VSVDASFVNNTTLSRETRILCSDARLTKGCLSAVLGESDQVSNVSLRFNQDNSWIASSKNGAYIASRTGKHWYLEGNTDITTYDTAFDGLYAYAVGEASGQGKALFSLDGCTWQEAPIDSSVDKVTKVVAVKSLGFVAMVGKAGHKTYIGALDQDFALSEKFMDGSYYSSLLFDGVRLIAAGEDGISATRDYPCPSAVFTLEKVNDSVSHVDKIVYNGCFYLVLVDGTIGRLQTLDEEPLLSLDSVSDVEWNGAVFVAGGEEILRTSCDGVEWVRAKSIAIFEDYDKADIVKIGWNGLRWAAIAKVTKKTCSCKKHCGCTCKCTQEKNIVLLSEGDRFPKCWQQQNLEGDLHSPTSITPLSYGSITMPVYSTWIGCFEDGLRRSSKGKEWTPCFFPSGTRIESKKKAAAFGDNKWVVVGSSSSTQDSTILFSNTTATKWYPAKSGAFSEQGCDVVFGKYLWVAVGVDTNGATIKYSRNGQEWKTAKNPFNIRGNKVAYSQGYFIAAGKDTNKGANIKISCDGCNWYNAGIEELEEALAVEAMPVGPKKDRWYVGGIPLTSSSAALVAANSDKLKQSDAFSGVSTQFVEIRAMKFNGCALALVGDGNGFNVQLNVSGANTTTTIPTSGSLTEVAWNGTRWLFGDNQGHVWHATARDGRNVSKVDIKANVGGVLSFGTNCSILGRVRFTLPIDFSADKGDVVPIVFDTSDEAIQELAVTLSQK